MKLYKIKSNPNNPRLIKDDKFEKLKKSIEEFPKMMELRPIVINSDNIVLGGNMRLKALKDLGYKDVPGEWIKRAEDLTDDETRRFIIADNVAFGEHDWEILANEWDYKELEDWGLEGFPFDEAKQLESKEDDFKQSDDMQVDIVLGDLIEIAEHRLLCGDSLDADQVAKLMNGEKADMVFTDPPYDLDKEDYVNIIPLFAENANIFIMHDDKGIANYLKRSNNTFLRFYVGKFDFCSPRGIDPYLEHILVLQERIGDAIKHQILGDRFSSIVKLDYRFRLKDESVGHNHQKPIDFIFKFINHFSLEGFKVLDLFLGSGSTMVAAHKSNRKCYGMELDPKYCQIIIDRMLNLDPNLEIKINGNEYKK